MAIDRVNAVFIGRVKDKDGFPGELLEDPLTGQQMIAYTPETWWEKAHLEQLRASRPQRDNTPSRAWPAKHRRLS